MDLLGRYSNRDILSRIRQVVAGHGRLTPPHRTVLSLIQSRPDWADSDRDLGANGATVVAIVKRAGIKSRDRLLFDGDVLAAIELYESGQSLLRSPATSRCPIGPS